MFDKGFKRYQNIAVHLQDCCIASSDKLLKRNPLISRKYIVFEEEQNDKLQFCLKSKLHYLRVIDLIEIVEVVIVVDRVDVVNELVDVSVMEVELKSTQSIEIRPCV